RADPPGLQQEPDRRVADRCVEPDARRLQPGSGRQPGVVDPPVDRGLGAGARQPVAGKRASAAPLIEKATNTSRKRRGKPRRFCFFRSARRANAAPSGCRILSFTIMVSASLTQRVWKKSKAKSRR